MDEWNIFLDKQSGKDFDRPQYKKLLRKLKKECGMPLAMFQYRTEIYENAALL